MSDIIDEWVDYVGIEDENLVEFERCSDCEGEGIIITKYYPATRYDPADTRLSQSNEKITHDGCMNQTPIYSFGVRIDRWQYLRDMVLEFESTLSARFRLQKIQPCNFHLCPYNPQGLFHHFRNTFHIFQSRHQRMVWKSVCGAKMLH